jgi:hypothetical protein
MPVLNQQATEGQCPPSKSASSGGQLCQQLPVVTPQAASHQTSHIANIGQSIGTASLNLLNHPAPTTTFTGRGVPLGLHVKQDTINKIITNQYVDFDMPLPMEQIC